MANRNNRRHFNRPELPESVIIDLRGRRVGSEDFATAALILKWCENEGYRGTSLRIAANIAMGLEAAVLLASRGQHEAAAKKAGDVLWVLKKDRTNAQAHNYRALGIIEIEGRNGQYYKIGNLVEWYMKTHFAIAKQVAEARKAEDFAMQEEAFEAEMFKQSMLDGKAAQEEAENAAIEFLTDYNNLARSA